MFWIIKDLDPGPFYALSFRETEYFGSLVAENIALSGNSLNRVDLTLAKRKLFYKCTGRSLVAS